MRIIHGDELRGFSANALERQSRDFSDSADRDRIPRPAACSLARHLTQYAGKTEPGPHGATVGSGDQAPVAQQFSPQRGLSWQPRNAPGRGQLQECRLRPHKRGNSVRRQRHQHQRRRSDIAILLRANSLGVSQHLGQHPAPAQHSALPLPRLCEHHPVARL